MPPRDTHEALGGAPDSADRWRPSLISLASAVLLGIVLIGIMLTGGVKILNELSTRDREVSLAQAAFLDRQRETVRDAVNEIVRRIASGRQETEQRVQAMVRARTTEAVAIAGHLYETYKDTHTLDEIKGMVREALRPIRFNKGRGYIFALGIDGIDHLAPANPELEGTLVRDSSGSPMDRLTSGMIDLALRREEGVYRYAWRHPDKATEQLFKKVAYVKLFDPFDWVIGSGEYVADVEEDIQDRVLADIRTFGMPQIDGLNIVRWDGLALLGPAQGRNILYLADSTGFSFVKASIRIAQEGGGFVQYDLGSASPIGEGQHLSYVQGIPGWGWAISATVRLDAIQEDLAAIRASVARNVRVAILQTLLVMLLMSLATAALVWRARTLMLRNMTLFFSFFRDASRTYTPIDLSRLSFSEFAALGRSANEMIRNLDITQKNLRQSQERFALAVQGTGDAVWIRDLERGEDWLSPRCLEMLGHDPEVVPNTFETLFALIHPDDRERVREAFQAHLERDVPFDLECRLATHAGSYIWVQQRAGAVRDAQGRATRVGGSFTDITKRRETEDRLRFTQAAMDDAIDGIMWVRVDDGRLEYVNNAVCQRLGYARADVMGMQASALDETLTLPRLRAYLETLETAPSINLETRQKTRDGDWLDMETTISRARRDETDLLLIWCRDVSALAAQTRNFVALLENTSDFVLIKDTEHRYQAASQTLAAFTGHASWRDMLGRTDQDLLPPEHADVTLAEERLLLDGALASLDEVQKWTSAGGTSHWMDVKKQLLHDRAGRVVGLFGICRNITRRKQDEQELHRSRQLLEGVLENSPALIYAKDRDGRYIFVNRQWETSFGLPRHQVIGRTDLDLFPEDIARQYRDNDQTVMATNRPLENEEPCPTGAGDGTADTVLLSRRVPLPDSMGVAEGICGISTDISDRKLMERELSTRVDELGQARRAALNMMFDLTEERKRADVLRDRAEAANRAKSNFLAAMSHEIRTPMNGVVGMIDLLRETPLSADQRTMMNIVRESAFSLLQIINDILDHSKIEAGRLHLESAPISVRDTVEGVIETLLANAAKKAVTLSLFVDPAIPPRVLGDQVRLRQILFNLAGNAIKFTQTTDNHQGRVRVRVGLKGIEPDGHGKGDGDHVHDRDGGNGQGARALIVMAISDNGIGMSEETIGKLFQPFTQADQSTTRRFGGTGLGLSVCRTLTTMMGGSIDVQSTLDEGSTFTVTLLLPVLADAAAEDPDLAGVRLGCLVNNPDDADIVERYCTARGATVVRLDSLSDLEATAEPPDAVVVSDTLGGATSDAVLAAIQEQAPLRFVFLTPDRLTTRHVAPTRNVVAVQSAPILRSTFLRAVAVATGRMSPDVEHEHGQQANARRRKAPTVEQARAAGQLILVAEDNVTSQDVIRRQLNQLGFACQVANDGLEALEALEGGRYALLLTDCHMPRMDGFALTTAIRQRGLLNADGAPLPIVSITASALQGEAERCFAVGMDDYLAKPLEIRKLKTLLGKWMPAHALADTDAPEAASDGAATDDAPALVPALVPADADGAPPLDPAVLRDVFGDDAQAIREVMNEFIEPARAIIDDLMAAVAGNQAQVSGDAAHKLKSAARAIGATALADLCQEVERAGKGGDLSRVKAIAPAIAPAFATVEAFITGTPTPTRGDEEAPEGGPDGQPIVDSAALLAVFGRDAEAVDLILTEFVAPSRDLLAVIDAAIADQAASDIIRTAYKLKSSARSIGAEALAHTGKAMIKACEAKDWAAVSTLQARLRQVFSEVEDQVLRLADALVAAPDGSADTNGQSPGETFMPLNHQSLSSLAFLVVDDEVFMRKLISRVLKGLGAASVTLCEDGLAALDHIKSEGADVILCDLNMPGMDGVEFLRHLTQTGFSGAIMLISGEDQRVLSTAKNLANAHGLHVLGALSKPITPAKLSAALESLDQTPALPRHAGQAVDRIGEDDLRRGIDRDELLVYFQPKVRIRDRKVVGVESLVRWRHPDHGLIPPMAFVPVAEDTGLIAALTDAVFAKATEQGGRWLAEGRDIKVAVNISVDSLTRFDLPQMIVETAASNGLDPSHIVLEVTETGLMRDLRSSLEILARLRLKGVSLSIDDFGTGHSSLEQLKRIPFNELKIDRAFVFGAARDPAARAILESSVGLARSLGMSTVAEGAETQEDWDLVASLGVDMVQGYVVAKPMPADEFDAWLATWEQANPG